MLDPEKTHEREPLLKRFQELYQEIDEGRSELNKEIESYLPIEEQFALNVQRYIETVFPKAPGKVCVTVARR